MSYQQNKRRCNLVVDSCCDLPRQLLDEAEVEVLEFTCHLDGKEFYDDMWKTMSPKDYYDHLRNGSDSSTMQVPMAQYVELFNRIAESGVPTVVLSFSSGLSGTFETARLVLDQVKAEHPEAEIYLVDTLLASIAEGLLALGAIRQRDRGLTAAELAAWAEEARYYVHGYFTLDSLEWLKKGGRIPPLVAGIGAKLDIKPILGFDLEGHLANLSMVRGRRKSIKAIDSLFEERSVDASQTSVVIGSADAEKDADAIEERASKHCKLHHVVRTTIGPVIGSHVGPGMIAFSFWGQDRRKAATVSDRIANRVRSEAGGRKATGQQTASRIAREAGDGRAELSVIDGGQAHDTAGTGTD